MRLFNWHIPGTRDLQKENDQLRKRIELLEKENGLRDQAASALRDANHALRMDVIKAQKTLDEWMSNYDSLRRDLQQRLEQVAHLQLERDPIAQLRQLRQEHGQERLRQNGAPEGTPTPKEKKEQTVKKEPALERKRDREAAIGL